MVCDSCGKRRVCACVELLDESIMPLVDTPLGLLTDEEAEKVVAALEDKPITLCGVDLLGFVKQLERRVPGLLADPTETQKTLRKALLKMSKVQPKPER